MANTEEVMVGLEELMFTQYTTYLKQVEALYTDGVVLDPLVDIETEDFEAFQGLQLPACMILAQDETDASLKDQMLDVRALIIIGVQDSDSKNVKKKMYRYGRALKAMFQPPQNRSLSQRVVSAKVTRIQCSRMATGDSGNDYARAFEAEVMCRVHQERGI